MVLFGLYVTIQWYMYFSEQIVIFVSTLDYFPQQLLFVSWFDARLLHGSVWKRK